MAQPKLENVEEQFNEAFVQPTQKNEKKVNYDVKNYLNTKLGKDETQKDVRIRVINLADGSNKVYDTIQMHYMASNQKSYVCSEQTKNLPEKVERRCPFCAIREQTKKEQQSCSKEQYEKLKEIYKQNGVIENYVMRVIDRSDEDFGPKFWKFTKKTLDLIRNLYRVNKEDEIDIFDFYEGKDIIITVKKTIDAKGKTKTEISAIQTANRQTPVSKDQTTIDKWLSDPKIWNDVYVAKPFEYLRIVIDGKKPYFDKTQQKWVEWKERNEVSTESEEEDDYEAEYHNKYANKGSDTNEESDDLPF